MSREFVYVPPASRQVSLGCALALGKTRRLPRRAALHRAKCMHVRHGVREQHEKSAAHNLLGPRDRSDYIQLFRDGDNDINGRRGATRARVVNVHVEPSDGVAVPLNHIMINDH